MTARSSRPELVERGFGYERYADRRRVQEVVPAGFIVEAALVALTYQAVWRPCIAARYLTIEALCLAEVTPEQCRVVRALNALLRSCAAGRPAL